MRRAIATGNHAPQPDAPHAQAQQRSGPSRYYVTPSLTVDLDQDVETSASDAVVLIGTGLHVTVRSEQTARQVLAAFDMSRDEIDSAIRFGQTGQV